jgi:hypothetical protein
VAHIFRVKAYNVKAYNLTGTGPAPDPTDTMGSDFDTLLGVYTGAAVNAGVRPQCGSGSQ